MKKIFTTTALGALMMTSNAFASGFHLKEQSVSAVGSALAGASATASDISYSYFNPASITRHKGTNFSGNVFYIAPHSKAKSATANIPLNPSNPIVSGNTGDIIKDAVLPSFYMSQELNNGFTAGFSVNAPFGLTTKLSDDWAGRMHGTLSKVVTTTATPMVAYKLDDKMSMAAGVAVQHVKARLRNSVNLGGGNEDKATLEGDTTDFGYVLGMLYEYSDATRFGIGYRSRIKQKLKGDVSFNGLASPMSQDINAILTTPAVISIGAHHDLNDKWSVMAEFQRTYWSSFDELRIKGEKTPTMSVTDEKWKDTNFYAIGASYKINDDLKVKYGLAFDQSAVGKDHRTPRVPDSDRTWYSTGLEYQINEKMEVNLAYTYIKATKGRINLAGTGNDSQRGSMTADFKSYVHIVGMGFNYNF